MICNKEGQVDDIILRESYMLFYQPRMVWKVYFSCWKSFSPIPGIICKW